VANLKTSYTDGARAIFFRAGVVLARWGLTADLMTIIGLLLQAATVPLIITGHFEWALVVGLVASLCDALDGAVARAGVGPTKAGAFLDSTLDRVSELMVSAALVVYFVREGPEWGPIVAVLVFMGSAQMVSYVRARAEALGVDCKVGFMSRPERLVGLGLGFLFSWWEPGGTSFLVWWLYLLAALTVVTVVHREVHVLRKLRAADRAPALEATPEPHADEHDKNGFSGDDFAGDDLWAEPTPPSGRGY
jgi:CDP-diacylglycerol--glycerol-3-phosphate 3-phosphatidyltransferase